MMIKRSARAWAPACALLVCHPMAWAQPAPQSAPDDAQLNEVVVRSGPAGSLPTYFPATVEGIGRRDIETRINAADSEDALKYFPSLLVRKRYIGDYNHAVLSTRASGTGNSARSLVYADGVLLSNLLGNGATFAPRWGLVSPEEIERVDVLYGPYSAAYPGNSAGAVVDFVTRMPERFEAHAKVSAFMQPFALYNTRRTYTGWQSSASLGNVHGPWSWRLGFGRLDSEGQPLTFTTRATPLAGAVPGQDRFGAPWFIDGAGLQYRTVQDHLKLRVARELAPGLRASYLLGWWRNASDAVNESYVSPNASGLTNLDRLEHHMHALTLSRRGVGDVDWSLAASMYDYARDTARRGPAGAGAGTLADMQGTGWATLAAKGTWRVGAGHAVEAGWQVEQHRLRTRTAGNLPDWYHGDAGTPGRFDGETRLQSVFAQDVWRFAPEWQAVLGLRAEHWQAQDGFTQSGDSAYAHPARSQTRLSPKVALSRQIGSDWQLKAAMGRAIRFPTVSELYQGAVTAGGISAVANPDLRPEASWTGEVSAVWHASEDSHLRVTVFRETTRDALYSQTHAGPPVTSSVQNVDRVRTTGLEAAWQSEGVMVPGLDLQASLTYADSKILANSGYVAVPGDTLGKWQPRVPRWRATVLAAWRLGERGSVSYGVRYSGVQYTSLDNRDVNGHAYMGSSRYLVTDLRLRYAAGKRWHAAFGIDNLNNAQYWNFHPYPQRTYSVELKFDHSAL